jgi:signal transduction histidine kinase/ligand-binding sensor domain-containing protein/AraC-like DNA-binding protein
MNRFGYIIIMYAVFIFLNQSAYSQPNRPFLRHITTDDGLSFNTVYCIQQDKDGFMWFGTFNGFDRFDGIEFKDYRLGEKRYLRIVFTMAVDGQGNIWHSGPLYKNYPESEKQQLIWRYIDDTLRQAGEFTDIVMGPNNKIYLCKDNKVFTGNTYSKDSVIYELLIKNDSIIKSIRRVNFDKNEKLWFGTDRGLFYYDSVTKNIFHFSRIDYPKQKYINDFLFDTEGNLWSVFINHIYKYDYKQNKTIEYFIPGAEKPVLNTICQSRNGTIWLGSTEQGLFYLDKRHNQFECLLEQKNISCLFEDLSGRLWIGTSNSGIYIYDSLRNFFSQLSLAFGDKSISSFHVNKIENAEKNGLWIGSMGYGLLYCDLDINKLSIIDAENNQINMLYRDGEGRIWYDHVEGLVCYDPVIKSIKKIKHPVPEQLPVMNYGNSLTEMVTFNGQLIISSDYGQVYSYNSLTEQFRLIFENRYHPVRSMMVKNDTLFIGVYGTGLVLINKKFEILDTLYHTNKDLGLINHCITSIHTDRFDTLWIAGYGGLSKFNPKTKQFENKFAFPESADYLTNIIEDSIGNLWLGSSKGIYKFDRRSQQFIFFNSNHGVPTGRFFITSCGTAGDGRMFFGGNNGIVQFNPYRVRTNLEKPPLVFTDFIINNRSKKRSKNKVHILGKNINYIENIHLKHNQNSFTIKYAALNFTSVHHNQYKYKLEGLDNDWQYAGNLSQATYTNLDGGNYIFYLMGSNNDGVWNEKARTLLISVEQPAWKTWWAIFTYVIMIIGIVTTIYYYNIRRMKLKNQLVIKTKESEGLQEIDKAKTHFFTNISHEFRTPLTLIIDPANQLLQDKQLGVKHERLINLIIKNAKRLLSLINQILDLAKLRGSKLLLRVEEVDFIDFIKPILNAFTSRAEALSIGYKIILPNKNIKLWIDKEKIEQTLINLLSNAFKFCQQGEIKVEVLEEKGKIIIIVEDTGIGIPASQIDKIFDNYFQADNPYTKDMAGTGIGLYLVKEYTNLHHGTIEVQSEENKGTIFTLSLLKGNEHLRPDQIIKEPTIPELEIIRDSGRKSVLEKETIDHTEIHEQKPTVLLIEDNPEMTKYISENLSDKYRIISATNGSEGFDKTLEHCPDIVISDVIMPLMDGYTYCETLKSNTRTSHIPLIMLTARNLDEDKIKGLTLGADDYLIKPFQLDELKLRIKYFLEQQEKIRKQFVRDFKLKSENEFILTLKDKFVQQVFSNIEKHFHDDQFGVEKLSDLMNMSRKHLHRKIKILTDQSPNELIRNFRLRKAKYLLSENSGTVTQVCYEVGFNNPSYFSKCFNEFFGENPSDFCKIRD